MSVLHVGLRSGRLSIDGLSNPSTYAYGASGNMTADGSGFSYAFDAENRMKTASGMSGGPYTYIYDGSGLRVKKSNGTAGTLYWRSLSGDTIAETDLSGNITSEYVFFAGRRIARRDASGNIFFYDADHLGTTRTMTDSSGNICYDADLTPYGQEITVHTNSCPQNYKFTGYERDSETGLDYAMFRYYNPRLGRFMSPDPLGGNVGNPQSMNRYAYVLNNPLNFTDPWGLECHQNPTTGAVSCTVDAKTDPPEIHFIDIPGICRTVYINGMNMSSSNGCSPNPPSDRGGHESGGGSTGGGNSPANTATISASKTPWYKNSCITGAIGSGALHVGIDSIGLIPEAGGIARVIGHQAGYVGVVADRAGSNIIKAVGGSTSTGSALAGLGDTSPEGLLSTGLTIAGFIPGAGQIVSIASIGLDAYKTAKAIGQCN